MNQADKNTTDWLAALEGQTVPDAQIVREARALRAELAYRREPAALNPQILTNILVATGLKPKKSKLRVWEKLGLLFQQQTSKLSLEWKVGLSFATSVLVGVIILYQVALQPPPSPRLKNSFSIPQALTAPNPQSKAEELKTAFTTLGITATVIEGDKAWIIEVPELPTSPPPALLALLEEYDLVLPVENGLLVRITAK